MFPWEIKLNLKYQTKTFYDRTKKTEIIGGL